MTHVFISYSRDDEEKSFIIQNFLQARGIMTFLDTDNIGCGDSWVEVVKNNLHLAFAVVVICTKNSMSSNEVLFEIAFAMGIEIRVIPLVYDDCDLFSCIRFLHNIDIRERGIIQSLNDLVNQLKKLQYDPIVSLREKCQNVGLVDIGSRRSQDARIFQFTNTLDSAADNSELIIIGRSLIDWSAKWIEIQEAINQKNLRVKLALLDIHNIQRINDHKYDSWIEMPNPRDWAINDVFHSMNSFERIIVKPNTGTLEIYGLPFYVSHSFVAYTNAKENARYCLQEAGMALGKAARPFIVVKNISPGCHAAYLEVMYKSLLTPERLILSDDGDNKRTKNTTQRSKIIAPKVEKFGLVDLAVDRTNIDWHINDRVGNNIGSLFDIFPKNGEIFLVGRSLAIWKNMYQELARSIVDKSLKCQLVMADARITGLKSLYHNDNVKGDYDYAEDDLPTCWDTFNNSFKNYLCALLRNNPNTDGFFELYGIPAYVPETFLSVSGPDGLKFCSLEAGIGVGPSQRTVLFFKNVSDQDIYTSLYSIYKKIIKGRQCVLRIDKESCM